MRKELNSAGLCRSEACWLSAGRTGLLSNALTVSLIVSLAPLSGCEKPMANGPSTTMTLLRSGSQEVCVAADVRKTLDGFILPKVAEVQGEGSAEDAERGIKSVALSYDLTTLQGFDKEVSKATCNATVKVSGSDDESKSFNIDYVVSPSADDPTGFIVTAGITEPKAFAFAMAAGAANELRSSREKQQQADDEQRTKTQVLSVANPRWFAGTWIAVGMDAANCGDERALTIAPDHTFTSQGRSGRWALNGDQIHFVGTGPTGSIDDVDKIVQADAVSFSASTSDGNTLSWRRCTRGEVASPSGEWAPLPANAADSSN